jgi:hypothetical protein
MALCKCGDAGGNLGVKNCYEAFGIGVGIFLMQTFKADGTRNSIPAITDVDDAFITAKLNNVDLAQRWYPLQNIKAIESERADDVTEEAPDGSITIIKEGVRPYAFYVLRGGAVLKKNIAKSRCKDYSFFIITKDNQLIGMDKTAGTELFPIRIEPSTLSSKLVLATDTTAEKVSVNFQFDQREDDGDLAAMDVNDDAELSGYNGLLDIKSTVVGTPTTTGFVIDLNDYFGPLNGKGKLTGLVAADFVLYNVTDSSVIVITSVTEATAGRYTFVIPAQTSGDELRLTPTKDGYDFSAVITNLVEIP